MIMMSYIVGFFCESRNQISILKLRYYNNMNKKSKKVDQYDQQPAEMPLTQFWYLTHRNTITAFK